eukprot:XP_006233003.1 PREDICTED: uncharacterized protein LOC100363520 isoform X4 [Rattus norvegicus]
MRPSAYGPGGQLEAPYCFRPFLLLPAPLCLLTLFPLPRRLSLQFAWVLARRSPGVKPGVGVVRPGPCGWEPELWGGLTEGESMSSLPGCMSLAAAPAAADSAEIAELQQAVVEELGISMEELRQFIDEELEKMDCIQQRKKQLAELETWVLQKESEVAYVDRLFDDASSFVKLWLP